MPRDPDHYDLFVSYARHDNRDGWISRFVDELRRAGGGLTCFVDQHDICSLDDWRLKIHDSLAQSRLLLAFVSPHYFASEWCRREWRTWIDHEIAKHILASGAAPVIVVEVPGLTRKVDERQVARIVAELCGLNAPYEPFIDEAAGIIKQVQRREFSNLESAFQTGLSAFDRAELQTVLARLGADLHQRAEQVRQAALSESTVPPYNRKFTGRLDELLLLRQRLQDDRAGVISGVHGLGGIGKTELAFTFAHAFASEYPGGRFLIPCERHDSLRRAVLHLGDRFRDQISDEQRMTVESYFSALAVCLQRRLATHGRILLVLDNVTDLRLLRATETDALTALGPQLHVLATTREATGQSGGIQWLTLGELTESESVELLEKHRDFANADERQAAQRIARRLGGFSLAVELVAAWLAEHPEVTCETCLQRLGLENLETLDDLTDDPNAELRRHNHERRLQAVLGPTLDSLSPAAHAILEFAALLSPDYVPLPWLQTLVAHEFPELSAQPVDGHLASWQELSGELFRLALFSRGEDDDSPLVRVHRLVQSLVRRELSAETLAARESAVEHLVDARVAALDKTTLWPDARWEVSPLDALANHWAEQNHPEAAWLLNQSAAYWDRLAAWTKAEPLMRRVVDVSEKSHGREHPKVAAALNNLAQLLQATNHLPEAAPLMRRALAIDEHSYGVEHPDVGRDLNNLAQLLQATNRLAEAESLMRRVVVIFEKSLGPEHPNVASALNNLALLLKATNRLAEAEPLYRRALAIFEQSLGPEHPNVANHLNNLAQLLKDTNRMAEAEPLIHRALAIDEQSYGAEHPNVARDLHNLAWLLKATNRAAEAEPLMRRALAIDEQSYGAEHPLVAIRRNNLAQFLKDTNRLAEAEPLMRSTLAILEQSLGSKHPEVAIALNNLAQLLTDTNRMAEAEPLMHRALAIDEQSYGAEHPDVARDLNNLAQLHQATNRLAEAEPLMRRALAIDERSYGAEHPKVAIHLNNLASLLQETNRIAEAEPLIRRALAIDEHSYGVEHPDVGRDLNNLAQLLQATNRLGEAESLMRRVVVIFEKSLGPEHPNVATALNNLAQLLQDTEQLAVAEPLMRRVVDILEKSLGPEHPEVAIGLNALAALLCATNRLMEAEPLMRRHVEIFRRFGKTTGHDHPHMESAIRNYDLLLRKLGGTGSHPYLERLLAKQRQDRAVAVEDYRLAANCRDEMARLDQAHNYESEFGRDVLRLLERLAALRCVAVPVKRAIGGRLRTAAEPTVLLAELQRGVEFVADELEEFEDYQFQGLRSQLEHVTETEKLFATLGLSRAVEKVGEGLGPDAWLAYAGHVNTRADRVLYCLANRFVQSPPTKDEAFQLAEIFDHLGQPYVASALRDRFRGDGAE